ncbi:hypothetical protein SLEP1_g31362 [Rubroshorea leprosula]|uniref:Uncharacterized protein n=1 Tax=Rubroshorea leprosula TaxID=152421 RepID=A0AAV5KAE3_9ROSI|nr:hypothetical protein SLEP1_g31362 [Rubroshorea leprosula]
MIRTSIGCLSVFDRVQVLLVAQRKRSRLGSDHGKLVEHLFCLGLGEAIHQSK